MPFDAGFVCAVIDELNSILPGRRVEKISQPEKSMVILSFGSTHNEHGKKEYKLMLNADSGNTGFYLTNHNYENPPSPPMFCMLLRKHLGSARVKEIRGYGYERTAEIVFDTRDELGYGCEKYLITEIMGTYSNIILLGPTRKILGAVRIVEFSETTKRPILPGMTYEMPPAQPNKIQIGSDSYTDFENYFSQKDTLTYKDLIARYSGISPLVAREIICRGMSKQGIYNHIQSYIDFLNKKAFTPTIIRDKEGNPRDYTFFTPRQYGDDYTYDTTASFGELCDLFFASKSKQATLHRRSLDITKLLSQNIARVEKKSALQKQDLLSCNNKEELLYKGELIKANLYLIKKGDSKVTVTDWSLQPPQEITLDIDPLLTPGENAQKYYKKYKKYKSAEVMLQQQIAMGEKELEYLSSVSSALSHATCDDELNEIRSELYQTGYLKKSPYRNKSKSKLQKPLHFISRNGLDIYCGKNNLQNDFLTHKFASKSDIWFHAKHMPGSHVILCCGEKEPGDDDYIDAAIIAAYYSHCNPGQKTEVDYTQVKNIKKPPKSHPGYVTYGTNYSITVTPDKEIIDKLLVKG